MVQYTCLGNSEAPAANSCFLPAAPRTRVHPSPPQKCAFPGARGGAGSSEASALPGLPLLLLPVASSTAAPGPCCPGGCRITGPVTAPCLPLPAMPPLVLLLLLPPPMLS